MRVICCIHSLSGGGAEHLMAGFASRLSQSHEVTLITLGRSADDLYALDTNVERVDLDLMRNSASPLHGLYNNYRRITALRKAIRERRPEVVISFCDLINVMTVLACRGLSVPVIVAEMSDPRFHRLSQPWATLRPFAYRRASAVTAVSLASLPAVSKFHGREAIHIPPAVDPPAFKSEDPPLPGRHRLVSLGRLSEEKRFEMMIQAFAKVAERFPDWDLEIAGAGPCHEQLNQMIDAESLDDRVRLRGRIEDVWSFLQGSEFFVSSSRYEGTPVSVLEAMTIGLPIVAVDCDSGINEVVTPDRNGILTENSISGLAAGLEKMIRDHHFRKRCSQFSEVAALNYSWDRFVQRYTEVMNRVKSKSA